MQSEDTFDDMDIAFGTNDNARELLRAAEYLERQMRQMLDADALSDDEREIAHSAKTNLADLVDLLDERATRELFEDARIEKVAHALDGVHDLSYDIMRMLEDHEDTIERIGYPEPNPYDVATEAKTGAEQHAERLRELADDEDDDCLVGDGGCSHPDTELTLYIRDAEWDMPQTLNVPGVCEMCETELILSYSLESVKNARIDDEDDAVADGGIAIGDLDLSNAYEGFDPDEVTLIDSNGTKYLVGWGDHGWFNIQAVEIQPNPKQNTSHQAVPTDDAITAFTPNGARTLMSVIEKGL